METLQTNLLIEKLIALLRKGDTLQHRNRLFITIHENKIRTLLAGDEFFKTLADEQQPILKKLAAQAKAAVEKRQADEKAAREKAEAARKAQIKKAREAATAAALAKEQEAELRRKKIHKANQAARTAGNNFAEAEKIAAAEGAEKK